MKRFTFLICCFFALCSASEPVVESQCLQEAGLAYEYPSDVCPSDCLCRFENDGQFGRECHLNGLWIPEAPPLFKPLAADPREISYSLSWRLFDRALAFECHPDVLKDDIKGNNIVAVSFGDQFPIYRFFNVWPWHGELQFDLQGALWAVFAPTHEYAPLINADYYVGIPITYAFNCWSFRLRGYHISCHIGDEFLVLRPDFDRRNPSSEFIDFFASYNFREQIRLYGGVGGAVTQDCTFRCGRFFVVAGMEVRPTPLRYYSVKNRLYGVPLFAMHFIYRDQMNRHLDSTYILGYEWGKTSGWQHKTRAFLEYHDGYSLEGQFCKRPTRYLSLKMTYGY